MISLDTGIVIFLVVAAIIHGFIKTKKYRENIKTIANKEYENEIEATIEELEDRLSDSQIMYEELEQDYWIHIGLLLGAISHSYCHTWYISIAIGLFIMFFGVKFLSLRPFSTATPDIT